MKVNFISQGFRKALSLRISQKFVVLLTAFIMIVTDMILITGIWNDPHFEVVRNIRYLHIVIAVLVIVYASLTRKWTRKLGLIFYVVLFTPLLLVGWFNQVAMATAVIPWKPFVGYSPIFFALAVLYSGSFLLNFSLILAFMAEVMVLWFYLKPYYSLNQLASGEPYSVMVFAFVSLCLLMFRYQDEQTYLRLMHQKARSELIENLARTFLTLRDRANTPLQTLYLLTEILKRKRTVDDDMIHILETSLTRLNSLNKKLIRYEAHIPWKSQKALMTDQEIDSWMLELEDELHKISDHQQGI